MTANQCRRPNLGNPSISEPFSLCWNRGDTEGTNGLNIAAGSCCSSTLTYFQCWTYCKVDESMFPTWLGCIRNTNHSWGAGCQAAPRLISLTSSTTTTTLPASTSTIEQEDTWELSARTASAASVSVTASATTPTVANTATNTPIASVSPTGTIKSMSPSTLRISLSGILCILLTISTLSL